MQDKNNVILWKFLLDPDLGPNGPKLGQVLSPRSKWD